MYAGRFTTGPPSIVRKKPDGKPSLLPKPRRTGSTDRASTDARRPSASYRSSSAEPARATVGLSGRLSREASASKLPLNRRSRSQQADRYGQSSVTPLRSSHYSRTPLKSPAEERQNRNWQASLDRALAFITVKDQRPISTMAWQRAEFARVLEGLGARGVAGASSGQPALTRPLTITRFVDVCSDLLAALAIRENKLNNDNYIAKLPNVAKRLLYPGAMSKSWLKTVNTLHAFPHALAFIAFFLDLVNHIETPMSDEWLYADKGELACLRRDFLQKSYARFQEDDAEFDDLVAEYLSGLKRLLGHDEGKVAELEDVIQQCRANLEDEAEACARAEEERVRARREAAGARVRGARAQRRDMRAQQHAERARAEELASAARQHDIDIHTLTAEIDQLTVELQTQEMSVSERAQMLDQVNYATRVIDSKQSLKEQVTKLLLQEETELALWQKRTLDSCVQYKQGLIHLASRFPALAQLSVDEQELMEASCVAAVSRAVETLRAHAAALADQRATHSRARAQHSRERHHLLEECRKKIAELQAQISREQQALDAETERVNSDAAAWAAERERLNDQIQALRASENDYAQAQAELDFWEKQDAAWKARLEEMRSYVLSLREELQQQLSAERRARADLVLAAVDTWHRALDHLEDDERHAPVNPAH